MIRTALDTNIISALWSKEPDYEKIWRKLDISNSDGYCILSAPAYCELMAYPNVGKQSIMDFLNTMSIEIDFHLGEAVWQRAADAYTAYATRRRRSGGGEAKRLLSDFIIGAHAVFNADRLLTRDTSRYKIDFPDLELMLLDRHIH